jgi:hypothetical protein
MPYVVGSKLSHLHFYVSYCLPQLSSKGETKTYVSAFFSQANALNPSSVSPCLKGANTINFFTVANYIELDQMTLWCYVT